MGLRMIDEHVLGPWYVDQNCHPAKNTYCKWENINSNQIIMLAYFFLSCTVSSVVSIFENTPVSHVGCSKRVLQPQVSASTFLLSTRWRAQNNLMPWLVSKSRFTKCKISSFPVCILDISIKFSSESLGSQKDKHLPTAPTPPSQLRHPNFSTSSGRPLLARRRANSTSFLKFFTGGNRWGSSIREQSKMIQSWKQRTGCFRLDYIYICSPPLPGPTKMTLKMQNHSFFNPRQC